MAGLDLPIESHVLQAFVTEGLKPLVDHVITFGAGHFYISQSDKGGLVFGGDLDGYNSYAQRGNLPMIEHVMSRGHGDDALPRAAAAPAPLGRHHGHDHGRQPDHRADADRGALPRTAAGATAASRRRPASGWCFAHTIAKDEPHPLNAPFTIERFRTGHLLDEKGAGPVPWHQ